MTRTQVSTTSIGSVDAKRFQAFFRRHGSGIAVITTAGPGGMHGLTATSFCSLSLDPPLLLVCIAKDSRTAMAISQNQLFAVHLLHARQRDLCDKFSRREADDSHKFDGLVMIKTSPVPVIADTLAWVLCNLWSEYKGGDHTIMVGQLVELSLEEESAPLIWHDGRFCYPESVHNTPGIFPEI